MTILDLVCFDDLDAYGAEITDPIQSLIQDNYHRIITPPGRNLDDPDFGLGLQMLLSGSAVDLVSIAPRIEGELLKDTRNSEVAATVKIVDGTTYAVAIQIVPNTDEVGPFNPFAMNLIASANGVSAA